MISNQKPLVKLYLPDVVTPSSKPPITRPVGFHLRKRKVPPILSLPHKDASPYALPRSQKTSPRARQIPPHTHRKTSSVLLQGNSPSTTTRVRIETPDGSLGLKMQRSSSLVNFLESPKAEKQEQHNGRNERGDKIGYYRQLFEQVISRNEGCADVLGEIKAGYEEVLRQAEMETMRTVKPQDSAADRDNLEANFCSYLIQENRQLAGQVDELRKKLVEVQKQNDKYRQYLQSDSYPTSISPTERRQNQPIASPQSVPKLNLGKVEKKGFHEEFMGLAEQFSQSWRDAMKGGR